MNAVALTSVSLRLSEIQLVERDALLGAGSQLAENERSIAHSSGVAADA